MENVIAFNNELSGLYDTKPPISKAKMAAITKAAMRAIKFYKHVVQSVEKFILKCRPEYKVPGLYVIDSIVRQSRHQFGSEKDVFAPRFARNILETFANLFRCAPEDKSRIIRVLNLWQKNNVFAPDVIQPIFDLADPNHPIHALGPCGGSGGGTNAPTNISGLSAGMNEMSSVVMNGLNMSSSGSATGPSASMQGVHDHGLIDDKLNSSVVGGGGGGGGVVGGMGGIGGGGLPDLSSLNTEKNRNSLLIGSVVPSSGSGCGVLRGNIYSNKRPGNALDCGSSSLLSKCREPLPAHEHFFMDSNSGANTSKILQQEIYNKYQRGGTVGAYDEDPCQLSNDNIVDCASSPVNVANSTSNNNNNNLLDNNNLKQLLNDPNVLRQLQTLQNFQKFKQDEQQHAMRLQDDIFEQHLQNVLKNSAAAAVVAAATATVPQQSSGQQDDNDFNKEVEFISEEQKIEVINLDGNDSRSPTPERDRYNRRRRTSRSRSHSRSHDRGGRRARRSRSLHSRSRSHSRSPRMLSRRRGSRDRDTRSNRDKERDREQERERRRKGLPEIRKEYLSVCSTTLWVGHLSKLVYQEELSDTFGSYGDIVSIDQIVPRGCAFIVMNRRQDAYKAMQNLRNHKLQGRVITISWAAGKGVKSKEWKDFWDLDLGVTFIPWKKLNESTDLDSLEEGGMFDEDSMPPWMKEKLNKTKNINISGLPGEVGLGPNLLNNSNNHNLNNSSGNGNFNDSGPGSASMLSSSGNPSLIFGIDTTQPPPGPPPPSGPPPPLLPLMPGQFSMAPPLNNATRMMAPPLNMPLHMPPIVQQHPPPLMMMPTFNPMSPQMGAAAVAAAAAAGMAPPPLMPPIAAPPNTNPTNVSHLAQFSATVAGKSNIPPPPPPIVPLMSANVGNINDDPMDIEMEDSDPVGNVNNSSTATNSNNNGNNANNSAPINMNTVGGGNIEPLMNFNIPPPALNLNEMNPMTGNNDAFAAGRERNRNGMGNDTNNNGTVAGGSRWSAASMNPAVGPETGGLNEDRWQDNGAGVALANMDMSNMLQRPDYVNPFESRGGGGGPPTGISGPMRNNGNFNNPGDFHRFNQPASLMQIRHPPPNLFNQRGPAVPSLFMRGQGGVGGHGPGSGPGGPMNRQSGPAFFRNRPFDRDGSGNYGFGGGGRGGRGGRGGPARGRHNWSDEEFDEIGSGNYKRRGGQGHGNNRFRDRDESSMRDRNMGRRASGAFRDRNAGEEHRDDHQRRNSGGADGNGPSTSHSTERRRSNDSPPQHSDMKSSTSKNEDDDWNNSEKKDYDESKALKSDENETTANNNQPQKAESGQQDERASPPKVRNEEVESGKQYDRIETREGENKRREVELESLSAAPTSFEAKTREEFRADDSQQHHEDNIFEANVGQAREDRELTRMDDSGSAYEPMLPEETKQPIKEHSSPREQGMMVQGGGSHTTEQSQDHEHQPAQEQSISNETED